MDPMLLARIAERSIAISLGGLSIVLGYRLFMNLPQIKAGRREDSPCRAASASISAVSGPGAFFSLFGAAIALTGVRSAYETRTLQTTDGDAAGGASRPCSSRRRAMPALALGRRASAHIGAPRRSAAHDGGAERGSKGLLRADAEPAAQG